MEVTSSRSATTEDGGRPPSSRPRHRPDIQGLRALAILLVVGYHAGLALPGGFIGVDVFFVVSGYVIGSLLVAELTASGSIRLGHFYARRARRLLPILGLVIAITLALGAIVTSPFGPQQLATSTATAGLGFVANLYLYRHVGYFDAWADDRNPFLHLWSLSVEEQIYLVLPLALLGLWRASTRWRPASDRRRTLLWMTALVSLASLALSALLTSGRSPIELEVPRRVAFYAMPTRLWEFGAGMILALLSGRASLRRSQASALGLLGLALIGWSAGTLDALAPFPGLNAVPVVTGAVCLLIAGSVDGFAARLLGSRPLRWVGDRSYGWYLWHWPAIVFSATLWPDAGLAPLLAAAATLPLAHLTYRLVEERWRHDHTIVGGRAVRLTAGWLAVPLVVILAVTAGSRQYWGLEQPVDWYDLADGHNNGCVLFNRDLANRWDEDRCTFPPAPDGVGGGASAGTILLLGDGLADSVSTGVIEAASARGLAVAQWARSGCPFAGRAPAQYLRCDEWQDDALALVDRLDPVLVVVANRSPDYTTASRSLVIADDEGRRPDDRESRLGAWRGAMAEVLDALDQREVPTIVVSAGPDFGTSFPRQGQSLVRPDTEPPTLDRATVEGRTRATATIEADLVALHPRTRLVDPLPHLCSPTECPAAIDGRWLYLGPQDLTRAGSRRLAEPLGAAIDELVG